MNSSALENSEILVWETKPALALYKNKNNLDNLWDEISECSNNFELSMDASFRRNTGSYYTGLSLAKHMVDELFENAGEEYIKEIRNKVLLEPCVGTGNFIFAFLRKIYECGYSLSDVKKILNNIYVCDSNINAIEVYKSLFRKVTMALWEISIENDYFEEHVGGSLLYDVTSLVPSYIKLEDVFPPKVINRGFDIIITNPPYKNLKAEKNKFENAYDYEQEKNRYSAISFDVKNKFKYSNEGVLNLYKLFVEKIVLEYSNVDAFISLLIPSTVLSDKTCEKLRTYILCNHCLSNVSVIKENNPYINAQQSLCTFLIKKNGKTNHIKITADFCKDPNQSTNISLGDILNSGTGNAIFSLPLEEYEMLRKIRNFPSIKDLSFIVNMRGELDLTSNSNQITLSRTDYPLLRGKNVGYFKLDSDPIEYVNLDFIENCNKRIYIEKPRIICQQVVNIHKERRVTFSLVERNFVLGNSCNFISVANNEYQIDLYCLLGLFNSPIIDWFFKLTSTNNHVNNYEIDSFPIPVDSPYLKQIGELTREFLETQNSVLLELIYNLSYACYGISNGKPTEAKNINIDDLTDVLHLSLKELLPNLSISSADSLLNGGVSLETVMTNMSVSLDVSTKKVCTHIINKYQKLKRGEILNHTTFKLSDLDLEMVRAVPQGGNWKDISEETINKSKRLKRITETGGRTTLYGRIDYNKPSYTITTYFNRPGNGTYIHPIHDRVISVREAARLQSFKDDYYFYGNKTELLKQVGNAVPPLLAYHIGKSIIEKTGYNKTIDLFCGAGGMTVGFKEAGMKSILGNDFDKSACITFKSNNPEINVLCDDITNLDVKRKIISIAIENEVDIICGGPPCQGFSHAGKRFVDDPRNQLFKDFIEVVTAVKPSIVVMENVEGMLTFNNGHVYKEIISLYEELGYKVEGRKLMASDYGVPQKRKRVIIICTRYDMNISPSTLFPLPITPNVETQITAYDAIFDLECLECGENTSCDNSKSISTYVKQLKSIIPFGSYLPLPIKEVTLEYGQISLF